MKTDPHERKSTDAALKALPMVEQIAQALLYEGYILYPYRRSALKNQQRWNFGVLYPESFTLATAGAEPNNMQVECLLLSGTQTVISVAVRFLHLAVSEPEDKDGSRDWHEAVEREVRFIDLDLGRLTASLMDIPFLFHPTRAAQAVPTQKGDIVSRQEIVQGLISVAAQHARGELYKLSVQIRNTTPLENPSGAARDRALMKSLVSTHVILTVTDGEFVSLLDPPPAYREAAAACRNVGAWPVLVGAEGERNCLLASPIILYDYPQLAPESAGDLFDGTEIDELLTLRILTLSEEEKREMRRSDAHARAILERSETLPVDQLIKMHGAVRGLRAVKRD